MIYKVKPGQVSYGEAIGIILLENYVPFVPGDVANATTYSFPVRFRRVDGFTVERIFRHDMTLLSDVLDAARDLQREGVRAITGDCGFMVIYQKELAAQLKIPIFMSSLLQIPFMEHLIADEHKIGIVTASATSLDDSVLKAAGASDPGRLAVRGLEHTEHFAKAVIDEIGELDTERVEKEVVSAARQLVADEPATRLILLECSLLPPYGAAVQDAVGLPVFDFVTMINHVFTAVVKRRFQGFM